MVESQQQYCLKWNNYQTSLTSTFKDLLASDHFVDCTLSCGQGAQTINAHRVVLSACSPYFRQVLSNLGAWQHPVVILKDIKYEDLTGIVEFIYHGEVSIDQDCLPGFLQAAESLRIKGLTEDSKGKDEPEKVAEDKITGQTQEKTNLIQKAFEKLMNGVNEVSNEPTPPPEEESENNNEHTMVSMEQHAALMGMEAEDEEEALSESEIRESNLKNLDFQTMYQNFMSGATSEDSEGGKDNVAPNLNEDGSLNFNFGDPNSPLGGGKKTCPFCFQQLSWHALSRHIRDMHRAKSDLVTCKYCMKTFRNKNSLGCHIWRFHKRGKELIGKDHAFDG
eukprot:GFUD01011330.1.p1 GENE.GFUD01011330.1~~GFUD01011330.1.p1  ORF type:complete len:335 (-),score=104.27 GFUD01011330.1:555-1559(-)